MGGQQVSGQAGWFADPAGRFDSRYWDGAAWTKAVMRGTVVETDDGEPPSQPAAAAGGLPYPAQPLAGALHAVPVSATDRFTSLSPAEAQARVTQMLAMSGVTIRQSAPGRVDAAVEIKNEPNWIVVVVLLFIWIVPGVIYWYVKSRPATHGISLVFVPAETGTRIAVQADGPALERLAPVMSQLPW